MRRLTGFLLTLGLLAGCAPANREQLVNEVLKADPEFSNLLEKYEHLTSRIKEHERRLALKRSTIERSIEELRRELASATTSTRKEIAAVKVQIQPDRERLQLALTMAGNELQQARQQRAILSRQITELRKAANKPSANWTAQERAQQEAKIAETLRDAKRLDQEMKGLKEHVRLLKIKLLLIKL